MVTQLTLNMNQMTERIDFKHELATNALPRILGVNELAKQKASKTRQASRAGGPTYVSPLGTQQQSPIGWMTSIKDGGKRNKPEAPKFLLLLYEILDVENSRVIRWSEDGLALQILDPVTVTEQILPKYFNHTNFHSFQRQLNYFGFRKWTKSKTDICTFSHHFFRENQPELLQLIKRKKAPRRAHSNGAGSTPHSGNFGSVVVSELNKLSPCGKRKLSLDKESPVGDSIQSTEMLLQMNTSANMPEPSINEMPLSALTTPHNASSNGPVGFSHDGLMRKYLPELNNVISPVAATECKKKAKKLDKKDYDASAAIHAPLASPHEVSNSLVHSSSVRFLPSATNLADKNSSANADSKYAVAASNSSKGSLPTLDIVRSRLKQQQHIGDPKQQQHRFIHQQQHYEYDGLTGVLRPNEFQRLIAPAIASGPEFLAQSIGMASVARAELSSVQSPVLSNSFNDPVSILLRIKKSRTPSGEGKDISEQQGRGANQNESLASLHNYLLGNSLYTNRLQAQLKFVTEENEALKQSLNSKKREVDSLQVERKALVQENAVLLEDKNKLFEINRDLLSKLFPQ
ncbi:hypothetical protein CCR75_003614 [Bremia lactucae]|uniref:HSF-type DNA-binding domain-containing protein n=1 Tax=Bremia lactucae TaxID=4779 RepID=A0A976FG40_BRELC|nr:hypothetical protein CCR75_003614 [Bremia lactucae]